MFRRTKVCSAVLVAFGGTLALGAAPASAQQTLDRVEITGSSIKRIDAESALPVTVIKVEDLAKQGVTTTEQAMARIAANQSNFGASAAIGGTTGGKSEADLRGLSGPTGTNANKTLVLLNGRRLANHAFDAAAVDLNAIPLSAVDRIEVLRDGASAHLRHRRHRRRDQLHHQARDSSASTSARRSTKPEAQGRWRHPARQPVRRLRLAGRAALQRDGVARLAQAERAGRRAIATSPRPASSAPRERDHSRHQRHRLPGRPERLRADAARTATRRVDPAQHHPTTRRFRQLPLRLHARRRSPDPERTGHRPAARLVRDHARTTRCRWST